MTINVNQAQDVWKDAGSSIDFITLKLNRNNLDKVQQNIALFLDRSQSILRSMKIRAANSNVRLSIGFSYSAWKFLFPNSDIPSELEEFKEIKSKDNLMPATEGDIFIHARATEEAVVFELVDQLLEFLKPIAEIVDETKGFRNFEGRAIIGFIDGTEAPDVQDAAEYALVGEDDPKFENGSYAFAQKWIHDIDFWKNLSIESQEKAIGRKKISDIELDDDKKYSNTHNVAAKIEIDSEEQKIIRMNVPFSDLNKNEIGTFFIGYSNHWKITKAMLSKMISQSDFLLSFSKVVSGQLYFIPSKKTIEEIIDGDFFKNE